MATLNHDVLIFIVDDNVEVQKLVLKKLNSENYMKVKAFSTLNELKNALQLKPDIIVIDNYLSQKQNDSVDSITNFITLKEQLPGTKFIILSGEDNPEVIREFIMKGAYGYIIKDTDSMDKLISSVHQISSIR